MRTPTTHSKSTPPDELIPDGLPETRIYLQMMRLKRQFRRGWLRSGVSPELCESVADHAWGCAMLCLLLARRAGLDAGRCALMALVHELGETHAGDITPHDSIAKTEKHARETAAIDRLFGSPDSPMTADAPGLSASLDVIRALWQEYEDGATPEARFVKRIDRLEMGYQAAAYRAEGKADMADFMENVHHALHASELSDLSADVIRA